MMLGRNTFFITLKIKETDAFDSMLGGWIHQIKFMWMWQFVLKVNT